MSRIAKKPIALPAGVEFKMIDGRFTIKGPKGVLSIAKPEGVEVDVDGNTLTMTPRSAQNDALAGTLRTILANMATGVSEGFQRKLELQGVGFRASMQGNDLNLSLGFSHPVLFSAPDGIAIETPTQTEILIKGADKQLVGQVAAKIRAFRPPEPYKGKGVRYSGEKVIIKQAKKA